MADMDSTRDEVLIDLIQAYERASAAYDPFDKNYILDKRIAAFRAMDALVAAINFHEVVWYNGKGYAKIRDDELVTFTDLVVCQRKT
jgi:hypothetical protein